jgi:hypothetical protein
MVALKQDVYKCLSGAILVQNLLIWSLTYDPGAYNFLQYSCFEIKFDS